MKRSDISTDVKVEADGYEFEYLVSDSVYKLVDDLESRVNECKDLLGDIKSVQDLNAIEECYDLLCELSKDLY